MDCPDLEQGTQVGLSRTEKQSCSSGTGASSQDEGHTVDDSAARDGASERMKYEPMTMFSGISGQALLVAIQLGTKQHLQAVRVPVYRPSVDWCEETRQEVRRDNRGETEEAIWKRIKRYVEAHHPWWYAFLPFWRALIVEERQLLLHAREGTGFKVGLKPSPSIAGALEEQQEAMDEAERYFVKYGPDSTG